MIDRIEVRGLRVSVVVGVLEHERHREQPVEMDLDLERSLERAAQLDDVAATTDYGAVLALAARVARAGHFQLLEALADHVARAVLASDDALEAVTVTARKLRPPVAEDVATVGVRRRVAR